MKYLIVFFFLFSAMSSSSTGPQASGLDTTTYCLKCGKSYSYCTCK